MNETSAEPSLEPSAEPAQTPETPVLVALGDDDVPVCTDGSCSL